MHEHEIALSRLLDELIDECRLHLNELKEVREWIKNGESVTGEDG